MQMRSNTGRHDGDEPPRSSRRPSRVDLSKLHLVSLKRYAKKYGLVDQEELVQAISHHFSGLKVDEEQDVLLRFCFALSKRGKGKTKSRGKNARA